jgi:hypothetical protein
MIRFCYSNKDTKDGGKGERVGRRGMTVAVPSAKSSLVAKPRRNKRKFGLDEFV